jgi:hypothetical protein
MSPPLNPSQSTSRCTTTTRTRAQFPSVHVAYVREAEVPVFLRHLHKIRHLFFFTLRPSQTNSHVLPRASEHTHGCLAVASPGDTSSDLALTNTIREDWQRWILQQRFKTQERAPELCRAYRRTRGWKQHSGRPGVVARAYKKPKPSNSAHTVAKRRHHHHQQ